MPYHLLISRYTPETWDRMSRTPENRMAASANGAADYDGHMVGYWYSAGARDVYSMSWAPDLQPAAALHMTLFESGAFLDFDHAVLLSVEEMKEAAHKSRTWPSLRSYSPPGLKPNMEPGQ